MKYSCKICEECEHILHLERGFLPSALFHGYPLCGVAPVVRIHPVYGRQDEHVPCKCRNKRHKPCPWWEPKKKSWWSRLWRK